MHPGKEMSARSKSESNTEKIKRRNRELSILNSIAQALNREVDLSQALQVTLAQVAELLDLQTGWIWLLRDDTGDSYLAAVQNLPPALAGAPRRMEGACYCLDTFRAGDLDGAANVNVVTCSRLNGLVDGTDGLRYHASIPLYAHGKKLGVLNVASADWRELEPEDLRLLYTVGDLTSIAIERARLFAQSVEFGAAEERNRLAREIHDTLAQGLTAIALQLETAEALLDEPATEADARRIRRAVGQALALTRANLEEARRSVLDLRATPLEGRTLAQALKMLAVQQEQAQRNLRVKLDVTGENRPLPVHIEAGLYRIAQEALTNVARHAGARHIRLRLATLSDRVQLIVQDDGRGFDLSQALPDHYGLIGMNERAKLLGGQLDIQSSPGAGTRIDVVIPLERKTP
jgi:two-component system NarL family sensor kinase